MKGVNVGEKVMAKWPGSALWFPAVVTKLGEDEDSYEVKFEDGTEDELPENHVSRESTFRRSRSRSRSPSRKSPSRKRSRSPARKASPARKPSPSRKAPVSPGRGRPKSARSPARATTTQIKTTPTRTQSKVTVRQEKTAQSATKRTTVSRTESHIYSTRSATRSGAQILESPVEVKTGRVPKTTNLEYGGPIGAFITIFFLPFLALYLWFACSKEKCELTYDLSIISLNWRDYYDCTAYEIFAGWIVFHALLSVLPIGRETRGQADPRTGLRHKYRLNGFAFFVLCIALFFSMVYFQCGLGVVLSKSLPLIGCGILVSFLLSIGLYIWARRAPLYAISPAGNSGNIIYDFLVGHELNPRPFHKSFDLKFVAMRIAAISWALLDLLYLEKAWTKFPNDPPYPLLCVAVCQIIFIMDSFYLEDTMLTSVTFQKEGAGFLLVFGSLVFIPFTYSLQARYLSDHPPTTMPQYCLVPVVVLFVVGWVIYRQSNSMKSRFRKNPHGKDVAELSSIPTSSGRRLLTAGWWGVVRRPNYLGDIMMALSFSLFCGFDSIIPYFYPLFIIPFLIFRERSDSAQLKIKYGQAWDRFCKEVPYRIIPYVY